MTDEFDPRPLDSRGDSLRKQLAAELGAAAALWLPVIGVEPGLELQRAATRAAARLALQMASGDDDELEQTVVDLMNLLYANSEPERGFWKTPVGRCCAAALGLEGSESLTITVAAAELGLLPDDVERLRTRASWIAILTAG